MKNYLHAILTVVAISVALPANSHEFWLTATPSGSPANPSAQLTLHVGENFSGELVGWTKSSVVALRMVDAASSEDLRDRLLSDTVVGGVNLRFKKAGTRLFSLDSEPSMITLGAEKFHAYLHDEGLDAIIKQREAAGTASTPGRERYRRHVKALLKIGNGADNGTHNGINGINAIYGVRTMQRLEIVPLVNPFTSGPGSTIKFAVLFDGKPLADALVKAWHKHGKQLVLIKARTDADGKLDITLPYAGPWMVSVVHMIAATDSAEVDWDSLWGNLTFDLPRKVAIKK